MGFFILEKQLANISDRGFLFLRSTLLLYSLMLWQESQFSTVYTLLLYSFDPYRQNDGMIDRGMNTLALRELEESAHASRGLEEPFFQLCCCISFWFWQEIDFGCTYYYVLGVQCSCGVVLVFLVLARNSFWCYVRT